MSIIFLPSFSENIALYRPTKFIHPTTQKAEGSPSWAVDGNANDRLGMSCTTIRGSDPWLRIDLQQTRLVGRVSNNSIFIRSK